MNVTYGPGTIQDLVSGAIKSLISATQISQKIDKESAISIVEKWITKELREQSFQVLGRSELSVIKNAVTEVTSKQMGPSPLQVLDEIEKEMIKNNTHEKET